MLRFLLLLSLLVPSIALANDSMSIMTVTDASGTQNYSVNIKILALMTMLMALPALLMVMSPFTRIIIVLALLRQALGTQQTPSNQILLGLALILTFFVMTPVIEKIERQAWQPLQAEQISDTEAFTLALEPVREFMLSQVYVEDIETFASFLEKDITLKDGEQIPFSILMPAFLTSELKIGFVTGLMIFIPFLIIDLLVASILMGLGMMMMPPAMVSLPLKLLVFIAIDGWTLISDTLVRGFIT